MKKSLNKTEAIFSYSDLHWRDSDSKEYKTAIDILNRLTEEEKQAVDLFGQSKYSKGSDDGYESGYSENSQ